MDTEGFSPFPESGGSTSSRICRDLVLKSTHLQYSFNGLHINVHDGLKQERGKQGEVPWVFYSLIRNKHALSQHLLNKGSTRVMQGH